MATSMGTKDFELVAVRLAETLESFRGTTIGEQARKTIIVLAYDLADSLERQYPHFDKDKFLEQCGVGGFDLEASHLPEVPLTDEQE